ncbi:MAG: InlB B-repeat-containing protein [Acutalibacteraceae bacterium]
MLFCLVPTTAFAADCAEDLVDPVIWIHLSSDGGGYYDVLNGTWTAADFFQPGKAPKGAKITAVMPPTSPSIPVSVNVNSDGTLNCTKTENTTEPVPKSETYTVTITSDDYAPISAPLTVRQYLNAGFRGPVYFDDELLYGDTYTYTCRVNNPGENGVWSALIQDPQMFEIYKETTDTTSEPGKSIYTVHIRAIKAGARVTCIDFLYVSDTTMASSKVSRGAVTGGAVRTRPLTVTAGSATITEGNALPTDLVTCTGLLNSEGRKDDRDTVLDNALGYQLLDANNEEVTADTARNTPGTYTVVPAATLKSGWGERYSLNKVNGTLTVENQPDEQFTLAPGGRYYFDLSAMNIPGTVNSNLPDSTLHYVPFTYVGTVNAYKLTSAMATTEEYAQQNKYAHSLFVADYAVTLKVNWNNLDTASLIFGKNYASGGVDYTLRAPSVGSGFTGSDDSERGTPQSNEWDAVLDKNSGYVKNWNDIYSWGQDTSSYESWYRAVRGSNSARYWSNGYASTSHPLVGFRPVLEVLNPGTLGADGLKSVTLDLGGGKLGNSSEDIQIIVKTGSDFTAPASDDLTRPDGDTGNFFMWRGSNGKFYVPGDSVPADVTALTVQWTVPTYAVTLHPNGGTINSGNVTGYTYGVGVTLPTADDMTNTGHTFKGWYDNENLTGSPVTAIGGTGTGNKEYWAKWEINQYTITVKPENGKADITITQDYGTNITAPADPTREGYTFMGWDREIPTTMPAENITLKARWKDIEKPTGEIVIGTNKWQKFLNKITFGLFFKDTQEVTINATDNSGTVFVSYLVTDQDLSEEELKSLVFSGYEEPFRIDRNGEYIVYAMLVDTNLNITYLRSDRVTVDNVQPVIGGIENGKTYCEAQTVTIDEKYLDTVTVNGTEVTLDENGSFILSAADGEQKIVATDKAGNTAEMTVTVNDGHTGGTATCTEKAVCEICGKAYGDLDGNHHANLKHIPAKAATRTAEGNIEYWYCEDCGKYFADAAATKEIKQADTVTAKLSGAAKSPQTGGDSGVVTVLLLSGGAFICLVSRRKKRTHTV